MDTAAMNTAIHISIRGPINIRSGRLRNGIRGCTRTSAIGH